MLTTIQLLVVSLLVVVVGLVAWTYLPPRGTGRLPPGPGPREAIPSLYPWRYFYTLSQRYGPVITVWSGRKPNVVLNDVASATFFLEKHARDTADRPANVVAEEIFSHGKRILLVGHNERWRRLRRAIHQPTQPASARDLRSVQERLATTLVADVLGDPGRFQSHVHTYAASLVVQMAYGRRGRARYSDPDIAEVIRGGNRLGTLLRPGSYATVNAHPWLRWVPGVLKTVNAWAADELRLYRSQFDNVKALISRDSSSVQPCFATYLLDNKAKFELNDDEIAYLLGSVFGAGSDTSSSAISIAVMAAATHRDEQAAVQKELDALVGDALPTFADLDDEEATPRLRAFISESFRWRPVSSGGFAHRTTTELEYEGFVIPAGTTITGNHWGIHRDKSYYGDDVEEFRPSRWLNDDGTYKSSMKHFQFGFGRRVCPGQHVANNSVLINTALLLWAFEISQPVDEKGQEVKIDTLAFTNTANSHPLPFQVKFTPRHDRLDLLLAEVAAE